MSRAMRPNRASSARTQVDRRHTASPGTSFWMGWVTYAGVVMLILGSFQVIEGTMALLDDEFFAVTRAVSRQPSPA